MSQGDREIFTRAKNGDADALRDLLKRHAGRARAALHGKIGPQWQAVLSVDDVMQVAFLEAFLHIDQLNADDDAGFAKWLCRIAENSLRDAIKELSRKKRPPPARQSVRGHQGDSYDLLIDQLVLNESTPSRGAARGEARKLLDAAVARLPDDYGSVVQLYDLEGLTVAEVASRLGRSEGAVYMLRARAHECLRSLLGSSTHFFSEGA